MMCLTSSASERGCASAADAINTSAAKTKRVCRMSARFICASDRSVGAASLFEWRFPRGHTFLPFIMGEPNQALICDPVGIHFAVALRSEHHRLHQRFLVVDA